MSRYGLSHYSPTGTVGGTHYGPDNAVVYSAEPFTATSDNYGSLKLRWNNPAGSWAKMMLVRNAFGFPANINDGTVLPLDGVNNYVFKEVTPTSYTDNNGLVPESFYYYSLFVFETVSYSWIRVGTTIGVSVKDFNNIKLMYDYLPEIYKISEPYNITSDVWANPYLYKFISVFGFELDFLQTLTSLLNSKYDYKKTYGGFIPTILHELGFEYEPEIGIQQGRKIMRDAIDMLQRKGSRRGLIDFLKDYTGYSIVEPEQITTVDVTGVTGNGSAITYTAVNSFVPGQTVTVRGVIPASYNVTNKTITSATSSTFTIAGTTTSSYISQGYAYNSQPNPPVNGITVGHNLMLDLNNSSFEQGIGNWTSYDGTATLSNPNVNDVSYVSVTSNVATITIGSHGYSVGNYVTITNTPYPMFNLSNEVITAVSSTTVSFALTSADIPKTYAYNYSLDKFGKLSPSPAPYAESTAPTLWPNKQNGVLSVGNASGTTATVSVYCGKDSPITKGVPVQGGAWYTFSAYAAKVTGSTSRYSNVSIEWYDRTGTSVGSTTVGSNVLIDSTNFIDTRRPFATGQAPATAYYAVPKITVSSISGSSANEWVYFDCAQFELQTASSPSSSSTPSDFDEARQLHITLKANRINEIHNPRFIATSSGPTVVGPWRVDGTATTAIDSAGLAPVSDIYNLNSVVISDSGGGISSVVLSLGTTHILQNTNVVNIKGVTGTYASILNGAHTLTGASGSVVTFNVSGSITEAGALVSGTLYQVNNTFYIVSGGGNIKVSSATGAGDEMPIYYPLTDYTFSVYVKTNGTTETVFPYIQWYDINKNPLTEYDGNNFSVNGSDWTRIHMTNSGPTQAAYAAVGIAWNSSTSGHRLYFDKALFETTDVVLDYFDGNNGPENISSLLWEGDINQSRSHFYKNFYAMELRLLSGLLDDYVTAGTTYAIYYGQSTT